MNTTAIKEIKKFIEDLDNNRKIVEIVLFAEEANYTILVLDIDKNKIAFLTPYKHVSEDTIKIYINGNLYSDLKVDEQLIYNIIYIISSMPGSFNILSKL